jgi:hypothetical protein
MFFAGISYQTSSAKRTVEMDHLSIFALIGIWVAVSAALAYYATTRGRPAGKWFLTALFLSPLLAFALLNKDDDPKSSEQK